MCPTPAGAVSPSRRGPSLAHPESAEVHGGLSHQGARKCCGTKAFSVVIGWVDRHLDQNQRHQGLGLPADVLL